MARGKKLYLNLSVLAVQEQRHLPDDRHLKSLLFGW